MKILVTGGAGLVGTAIRMREAENVVPHRIVAVGSETADLRNREEVDALLEREKPDAIIHTAARVGGIGRNLNSPAQQFTDNILMNTHVIDSAYRHGVKKLVAFGSVCAFPKDVFYPNEQSIHDGAPFPAHGSYAYAKRMVDVQIEAYNKQYGLNYCSVIPGNIFGEHDNFNLEDGHVIPSLIHKCFLAKKHNEPFKVWGSGKAEREFLYAGDVAKVCLALLELDYPPQKLIVSGDKPTPISKMVDHICLGFGYYNTQYQPLLPEGQLRRETDTSLFKKTFPDFKFTSLATAIDNTIYWFKNNYPFIRD